MKTNFLLAFFAVILLSSSVIAQNDYDKLDGIAVQVAESLQKEEYSKVVVHFDSTMRMHLSEESLKGLMSQLNVQCGKIQEIKKAEITHVDVKGSRGVILPCQFEKGGFNLQFFFNQENKVSGFFIKPGTPSGGYTSKNESYTATDINFENPLAGIKLAGTITFPKNITNCPGVILVTGSGPQDRNEEILGQKPFERIADCLSSHGIAVLRYDDRGIGKSEGNFAQSTTYDFLSDALAGFNYLSNYPGIDKKNVGIIGHSEGACIAAMAASQNKEIGFICMLAGIAITGEDVLLLQFRDISKASGMDEQSIQKGMDRNARLFSIINKKPDNTKAKELLAVEFNEIDGLPDDQKQMQIEGLVSPWMRAFLKFDPKESLLQVTCHALALFGEKDLQVPPKENIDALNKITQNKIPNPFTIKTISGVNHLFQNAQTGLMDEYSNTKEVAMNNETMKVLLDWIIKTTK